MADGVRSLVPLTYGWEDLPKSISVHGADPRIRLREPVPGVLCQLDDGWLLLDTGFNDPLVRDRPLYRRFHGRNHDIQPELLPGEQDSLEVAFETVGIDPGDVVAVALSHLHNDHVGGLRHFAERVPVHCQRRELEYGLSTGDGRGARGDPGRTGGLGPEQHGIFRIDFDDPLIDWCLADGEVDLAPGIVAVPTYGHTPGHQSFVIALTDKAAELARAPGYVLAFDAADLQENVDDERPVGGFIDCDPEETADAIRRLKAIAAERGYPVIPGHDPDVWPAFTASLGVAGPGGGI
jgi:glyoxylase-like metal-dependent hydrolase (beta-lactamase superfamily II)